MITIDGAACRSALMDLSIQIQNAMVTVVRESVAETEKHAKATTLWKDQTGKTRRSIAGRAQGAIYGEVKAAGAAKYLEHGTPPHVIEPKRGGALRFVVAGRTVFARRVQHPGTAERPFMQQARDHGQQVADYGAEFYVSSAIERYDARG